MIRLRSWRALVASLLVTIELVVAFAPASPARADALRDYPVPGGWFYSQESRFPDDWPPYRGYTVVDDADASFWTEFRRFGGVETLGYPVTRRYRWPDDAGYLYQAFQRGVLQWRPEDGAARLANVFEMFTQAGLDDRLEQEGMPKPAQVTSLPFAADAERRLTWLTEPRFLARYLWDPVYDAPYDAIEASWDQWGLPQSFPQRPVYLREKAEGKYGAPLYLPYVAQRFQKMAFQLFLDDRPYDPTIVPGDGKKGCVTVTAIGRLARRIGANTLIPKDALQTEPPTPQGRGYVTWYVPKVDPSQPFVDFELVGVGFEPGEPVTVTLAPPKDSDYDAIVVRVASTDADGSFDQLVHARVLKYKLSAVGVRSKITLEPGRDHTIDLAKPTETSNSSRATFC